MKKHILSKIAVIAIMSLVLLSALLYIGAARTDYAHTDKNCFDTTLEYSRASFEYAISGFRTPNIISFNSEYELEPNNEWTYADEFAGVWYCDGGFLNIGVVKNTCTALQKGIPFVVYHQTEFSYNQLMRIHTALVDLMPSYSIFGVALHPQYNRIGLSLENLNYIRSINDYLQSLNLFYYGSVYFIQGNRPTPHSAAINTQDNQIIATQDDEPLWPPYFAILGGSGILYQMGGTFRGTMSATAICNITNRKGVITNAHVASSRGRNFRWAQAQNRNGGGQVAGSIIANRRAQYAMGGPASSNLADATFLPFDDQDYWEFTSAAHYFINPPVPGPSAITQRGAIRRTYTISSRDEIQVGLPIMMTGETTGRTHGQITAINNVVTVDNFYTYPFSRTFVDQIEHNAFGLSGDSGSPVFIMSGGRYILAATHFAGNNEGSIGHASKITNIQHILGVTVMAPLAEVSPVSFNEQTGIVAWSCNVVGVMAQHVGGYHLYINGERQTEDIITGTTFDINTLDREFGIGSFDIQIRTIWGGGNVNPREWLGALNIYRGGINDSHLSNIANFVVSESLAVPTGLELNTTTNMLTWQQADYADGYFLYVDGQRRTHTRINQTYFDMSLIMHTLQAGIYYVQIRSSSSAAYRLDSELSEGLYMTIEGIVGITANRHTFRVYRFQELDLNTELTITVETVGDVDDSFSFVFTSNPQIATLTNGVLTFNGHGVVRLQAVSNYGARRSDEIVITVDGFPSIDRVDVSQTSFSVYRGHTFDLNYNLRPRVIAHSGVDVPHEFWIYSGYDIAEIVDGVLVFSGVGEVVIHVGPDFLLEIHGVVTILVNDTCDDCGRYPCMCDVGCRGCGTIGFGDVWLGGAMLLVVIGVVVLVLFRKKRETV